MRSRDALLPTSPRAVARWEGIFGDSMGNIADGLHPNDAGAMRIAETVFCALVPGGPKCAAAPPPPRDAGVDAGREATVDLGGDAIAEAGAEIAHADAHADADADADGEEAHTPPPDLGPDRDAEVGPKDVAAAMRGQGGQGSPRPEPEPQPEPQPEPAHRAAASCHHQATPAPPSLVAPALAAVALIIRRRRSR